MNLISHASIWILAMWMLAGCSSSPSRGSEKVLYTVADTLEVKDTDAGKSIQLRLNQKLFFHFAKDPNAPGQWEMVEYDPRTLLLLSENPRTLEGAWGLLFEGRGLGSGRVILRFVPSGEGESPRTLTFEISVRR